MKTGFWDVLERFWVHTLQLGHRFPGERYVLVRILHREPRDASA